MNEIAIEGIKFYAYHGFYEEERENGNHFIVDIYIDLDFTEAAKEDTIAGTIDYVEVFKICQKEMLEKRKLLETVAYNIATEVKATFEEAKKVKIKISKVHPPLEADTEHFAVTYNTP